MKTGFTIDLVWLNQQEDDILVACIVDAGENLNHHSYHLSLATIVSVKCDDTTHPQMDRTSGEACRKIEQPKFPVELKALLAPLSPLSSHVDINTCDGHILDSITIALNTASPNTTRTHKHKAWWK